MGWPHGSRVIKSRKSPKEPLDCASLTTWLSRALSIGYEAKSGAFTTSWPQKFPYFHPRIQWDFSGWQYGVPQESAKYDPQAKSSVLPLLMCSWSKNGFGTFLWLKRIKRKSIFNDTWKLYEIQIVVFTQIKFRWNTATLRHWCIIYGRAE